MEAMIQSFRHKVYIKIPGGEIQLGKISRSITVWFRGNRYIVKKGRF